MASGETHLPRKNGDVPHSLDRENARTDASHRHRSPGETRQRASLALAQRPRAYRAARGAENERPDELPRRFLVEMGGVEPPSRAFSRGYATGLVGVLLSLPGSHRQDPGQPSRITLDLARTGAWARGTPVLRRPLRTHQGRVRADVAA
jgi:peptidoglycan/xylan/chitin deacetylase (PgdA/CDA1 family)